MSVESALLISNAITLLAFLSTLGALIWSINTQDKKERKYINAVLAKDLNDYSKAEVKQSVIDNPERFEIEGKPEFILESELSDEDFFKSIEQN